MTFHSKILICLYLLLTCCRVNAGFIYGDVIHVTDGDTLTVMTKNNQKVIIRLNGIDAPEKGQAFGHESKKALVKLTLQQHVYVEFSKEDKYQRIIGRVYTNNIDVNAELVKQGMAWVYRKYTDDTLLYELESKAQKNHIGLWSGSEKPIPPWDWRKGKHTKAYKKKLIIGNRNSYVYHLPDCPSYGKVSEKNKKLFESEDLAVAKGYRKAGNCRL